MRNKDTAAISMLFLLLLLALLALVPLYAGTKPAMALADGQDEVLRLHVLANSDSEEDQRIKLAVRDALLPYFEQTATYRDARAYLTRHGDAIQKAAETALACEGADYGVYLTLGQSAFPDRTYDGILFPAGDYDALTVVLGEGGGKNWWCVLFPPLCIVTKDGVEIDLETVEYRSAIYDWLVAHVEGFPW